MNAIEALTSIAEGSVIQGQGRESVPSWFFAVLYEDGSHEEMHFTVGIKHKVMEEAQATCIAKRAQLARQAGVI